MSLLTLINKLSRLLKQQLTGMFIWDYQKGLFGRRGFKAL